MTDDARVYSALREATGLPGTKYAWPLGSAPPLPWFVYYRARGGEVHADNTNYHLLPRYVAELYLAENVPETVDAFEEAVRSLGTFTRRDEWLEGEGCMMHRFAFTLLPQREE